MYIMDTRDLLLRTGVHGNELVEWMGKLIQMKYFDVETISPRRDTNELRYNLERKWCINFGPLWRHLSDANVPIGWLSETI